MSKEFHLLTVTFLNIFKFLIKIKEIQHNFHNSKHYINVRRAQTSIHRNKFFFIQQKLAFKDDIKLIIYKIHRRRRRLSARQYKLFV